MIISSADIKDAENIVNIAKLILPIYYDLDTTLYFIENNIVIKLEINNQIIGFLLAEKQDKNIHIHSIGVSKDHQRNGIGTKLINHLKNFNYASLSLNVSEINYSGINFYEKNGFLKVKFKKNYYDGLTNNNAYLMCYK